MGSHCGLFYSAGCVLPAVGGRGELVDLLKRFIEAPLLFVATVQRNGFYRIVCFQQAPGREIESPANDIGMDGGIYEGVKAGLEFFPVDHELPAELVNGVFGKKICIYVLPDLRDQLRILFCHSVERFTATYPEPCGGWKIKLNSCVERAGKPCY